MQPAVAYIVTDILRDAIDYGTGTGVRAAGFRGIAAGKTGTTNNATDAWFVGYTPDLVGAVWIGFDRPSPLGSAATGGGFAAPIFGRVMRQIHDRSTGSRSPPADWPVPNGVLQYRIDPYTGLVLQDGCEPYGGGASSELFVRDHLPASTCPYRDWWGGMWDRLGDIFRGEGRDPRGGRGNVTPRSGTGRGSGRDLRIESEPFSRPPAASPARPGAGAPPDPRRDNGPPGLQRGDQMDDFMRERSQRLRRSGAGGTGG
jgi:membrane peptidoglycan carboxypeptidase